MKPMLEDLQGWLWPGGILIGAVFLALIGHTVIFAAAAWLARKTDNDVDNFLVLHARKGTRVLFPILAVFLTIPVLPLPPDAAGAIRHFFGLCLIASVGWLLIEIAKVVNDLILLKHDVLDPDNLQARQIHTKFQIFNRIWMYLVVFLSLIFILMTFPAIRLISVSLFATAGLAGIVVAVAARPVLANFIAGLQVALTDPIRLDDVVIVEGEWGWIEEIGTTYVVVRIWDLRRLILPMSYFIERPFQNWTRKTANLLGTVFIYADYTVPVEEVRQELHRILESSPLWDQKVWGLQITNATEQTLELRALMSFTDSSKGWDLRCYVREKLIQFLQQRYPQSLPKTRAEFQAGSLPLR